MAFAPCILQHGSNIRNNWPDFIFFGKVSICPINCLCIGIYLLQTILISLIGGWLGVFVFYFAGSFVFDWWSKISKQVIRNSQKKIESLFGLRMISVF